MQFSYSLEKKSKASIEDYVVLREFQDVSPDEIPRLPPTWDIDFTINFIPRSTHVSKSPYKMSIPKLTELKMKLQELLDKKYIRLSV